ncbi:hypothetical protein ACFQY5_33985 [Paeniroseomonas aquatica]|uniref:RCK C-terminal domain-containing protein n=1 Tax=Paeniroseomonas aquatica TaxID=373043 RepID=A0ABT8A3S6_9PROT|nr:hypothetical protein [Paeniroseomonas aquatica]MDN3564351.1 hypothetical protein [Paeniroseomonas aquatica]
MVLRDQDGRRHALKPGALLGACEMVEQDTTLLLLPGGKMVVVSYDLDTVLEALQPSRPT